MRKTMQLRSLDGGEFLPSRSGRFAAEERAVVSIG
jgi:hypothetical protein